MTTNFGLIIHWNWIIYLNALFEDATVFLTVQEDIPSLQISRIEPKNKFRI